MRGSCRFSATVRWRAAAADHPSRHLPRCAVGSDRARPRRYFGGFSRHIRRCIRAENNRPGKTRAGSAICGFGRHFRCNVELSVRPARLPVSYAQQLAQKLFAVPVPVCPRRIKKIDAAVDRKLQRTERLRIIAARPAAHSPHPIADFADVPSGAPKSPILHLGISSTGGDIIPGALAWLAAKERFEPAFRRGVLRTEAMFARQLALREKPTECGTRVTFPRVPERRSCRVAQARR